MVSILSIPEQKTSQSSSLELKPGPVRDRLAQLPLLNSRESLDAIFDILYEFNRVATVPKLRLRLLELYRVPIGFVSQNIERSLVESYIPLSASNAEIADRCMQVIAEMAYGYKSVVIDLAKGGQSKKSHGDLCTAIHRAIKYLTLSLYQSATAYTSHIPGTWVEIHSLYTYAAKLGIHTRQVKDALNTTSAQSSVTHAYQQALLFGLSDCYRHPLPINAKTLQYLDRWASAAELTRFKTPAATQFHFVIDPQQDRPACAYAEDMDLKRSKRHMLFNTREISKITHNYWKRLDSGVNIETSSLGEEFFDATAYEMLKRMAVNWGNTQRRRHPRNTIADPYQLALGVDAGNYFLNGGDHLQLASGGTDKGTQVSTSGTFGLQQISKRQPGFETQVWQGRDESIRGLCLFAGLSQPSSVRIRVGEIVAFRLNSADVQWSVGLVRWVRIMESELRIGLEKIGVGAKAVAVKPVSPDGNAGLVFKDSIMLPGRESVRQRQSLITPPGIYNPDGRLIVDDGRAVYQVRTGRMLEYGRRYEWFECKGELSP